MLDERGLKEGREEGCLEEGRKDGNVEEERERERGRKDILWRNEGRNKGRQR